MTSTMTSTMMSSIGPMFGMGAPEED
jgi:hypothetical protein